MHSAALAIPASLLLGNLHKRIYLEIAHFISLNQGRGDDVRRKNSNLDPAVRHGKPIIKGTRIPVEIILGSLAGGMEIVEIIMEYDLEREDVLAALAYAARTIAGEEIGTHA